MLRWLATALILSLFAINLALPGTSIGRRGSDDRALSEVSGAAGEVGKPMPRFDLESISGERIDSDSLLGHPVLLIFERSVDC
jgi:cytochrome oxidase Cu insertion factor (SCO1/SenC/PrrC family)